MKNKINFAYLAEFFAYLIFLVSIGILSEPGTFELWQSDLVSAAAKQAYGDPNSFASAALDVAKFGWVTTNTQWVFNLWPPGFVLVEGFLMKVFGILSPMPLILLFCSGSLFSFVMIEMRRVLKDSIGKLAWIAPLLLFSFPASRVFLLGVTGLLFGEWLAIGSFFLAILLMIRSSGKSYIVAGFLFALSAYARSQYEFFLTIMLFVTAGFAVLSFLKTKDAKGYFSNNPFKMLALALVVAQVVMLPWRIYHVAKGADLRWVYASDYLVETSLKTDEVLRADGAGWMVDGGVNVACHLAPEHCGEKENSVYKRIFFKNMFGWVGAKAGLIPSYWMGAEGSFTSPTENNTIGHLFNLLFALSLAGSFALLWINRKAEDAALWLGSTVGLLVAHAIIITFSHLEVRYFYFIKMYGMFSFVIRLAQAVKIQFQKAEVK